MPATAEDAKGMMVAAIRDPNPVLFFEHMYLYHGVRGEVPERRLHRPPSTGAFVRREGRDVTVAATGWMVHQALAVAERLAGEGDRGGGARPAPAWPPWTLETLTASVRKTGRLVVAHEAWKIGGFGGRGGGRRRAEACFYHLDAPVVRVGAPHAPVPISKPLRDLFLPDERTSWRRCGASWRVSASAARDARARTSQLGQHGGEMPLRTPQQYLDSLRDGRRVFYRGERVEDVTTHPVIGVAVAPRRHRLRDGRGARATATWPSSTATAPFSRYYAVPRTTEDLLARSRPDRGGAPRRAARWSS